MYTYFEHWGLGIKVFRFHLESWCKRDSDPRLEDTVRTL